jgi:Type I restriction modification DNA specificity domain
MSFELSGTVNTSKVFIERKTNVTGRWDPFFYRPELVALEKRVRKVTPHQLREFVRSMAGGATPSTTEADTHYTEAEDGVPFIRVQNLSTTGKLNLEDCKRITRGTHEGLLKRSRLNGGELLVKITGVGRMAVASVVPEGFEGNINQHIVAIRTKDMATSETIAAYLNLDLAERLASRRSTGGTRPALDYPALLSIPVVVDDRIPELMKAAVERYQSQTKMADELLATIDDVLLDELGIPRQPEPPNTLQSRIFRRDFSDVSGGRFDPFYNSPAYTEHDDTIEQHAAFCRLRNAGNLVRGVVYSSTDERDSGQTVLRANNINLSTGDLDLRNLVHIRDDFEFDSRQRLYRDDILICAASGSKDHAGKVAYIAEEIDAFFGGFMMVLRCDRPNLLPEYLAYYMQSQLFRRSIFRHLGGTNINNLSISMVGNLGVIVPDKGLQKRILETIRSLKAKASALREQARADLEKAKRDIEALILGQEVRE